MKNYYDESVYLNGNSLALDIINSRRTKFANNRACNMYYYEEEIKKYKEFLSKVRELLLEIKTNNSIYNALLISYLTRSGYFSLTDDFELTTKLPYEIDGFLGMNIIYGSGCCRNLSSFFEDVSNQLDMFCKKFYCNVHNGRLNFGRITEANHVINLIEFDDTIYGIDTMGPMLFRFIDPNQMKSISAYNKVYLRYKPYYEIITKNTSLDNIKHNYDIFKIQSERDSISTYEIDEIKTSVKHLLMEERSLLEDFKRETMILKEDIYNGIKDKFEHEKDISL